MPKINKIKRKRIPIFTKPTIISPFDIMSREDMQFQARNDLMVLKQAKEINQDKMRLERARQLGKEEINNIKKVI